MTYCAFNVLYLDKIETVGMWWVRVKHCTVAGKKINTCSQDRILDQKGYCKIQKSRYETLLL